MNGQLPGAPLTWCDVLEAEFRALHGEAALDGEAPADPAERLRAIHARIHQRGPSAVCLSGGGIRSATFALGVLQGLAHVGVLRSIDYLSTVSGGGYIGGWLTTWLHRERAQGGDKVMRELDPATACQAASLDAQSPVDRVRSTCRYLAPRGGAVSADVWSLVMTLARNLLLNWLVILPLLAAALLLPRLFYAIVHAVEQKTSVTGVCGWQQLAGPPQWFLAAAAIGFLTAAGFLVLSFVGYGGQWSQGRFLSLFLLPSVIAAASMALFWAATPCSLDAGPSLFLSAVVPAAGWLVVGAARNGVKSMVTALAALGLGLTALWVATDRLVPGVEQRESYRVLGTVALLIALAAGAQRLWPSLPVDDGSTLRIRVGARTVVAALVAGTMLGGATYWFADRFAFAAGLRESYAAFAVPILLLLGLLNVMIFVGVASNELDDSALEWWSRASGWMAIAALLWAAAGLLVFYMGDVVETGLRAASNRLAIDHDTSSIVLAVLAPLLGSLAGLAARAKRTDPGLRRALQRGALPLLILGLLSSIAWADQQMVDRLEYHRASAGILCTPEMAATGPLGGPCHPAGAGLGEVLMLMGGLVAFGLLTSRMVPVNRFSLHGMYCQRLIRTFLGASRRDRRPNAFTGFDSRDDVRVHDLAGVRPLHVINTTLNAVESTHVGRHETNAQSFTFSPLHVGSQYLGYRPAADYGSDSAGKRKGLSLGMALAVSGAAASSAMGMYSTKARAFLLTLANARLGLWFGNPQCERTWRQSEPPLGVEPLARELLGLTTDHNPYVYLSDGGHYENLGLWEMVARRCRFVVVSDASCDPTYAFGDLSNATRRIRLDLGVPILFPPLTQSREGQGRSNCHCAVGVIEYSAVDGAGAPDGTILYLKATLSGDEPADVRHFTTADPMFPHESTSNQFFDEARFESYRLLGVHTVLSVTAGRQGIDSAESLCTIARKVLRNEGADVVEGVD